MANESVAKACGSPCLAVVSGVGNKLLILWKGIFKPGRIFRSQFCKYFFPNKNA